MDCCFGPNMNADSENYNYFSSYAKVSYEGFINENYFHVKTQEKNLVQNLEITHSVTKNPINYKKDAFLGLFLKSKFDGIGNRHPLNLSIALDISGSMGTCDNNDSKDRITLAKESLNKLVSIMDEKNDKMSLTTFNHNTQKIFGMLNKSEIEKKYLADINAIKSGGGTDLVLALQSAMDNINVNNNNDDEKNKDKRIIMITDADYFDDDDKLLNLFKTCVEEKGISITIMAISCNSNLSLADKICHLKGCNYFPITKADELETFLVKYYNYIFFPIAHETKLTVKSHNSKIIRCIGDNNELPNEFDNENNNEIFKPSDEITFDFGSAFSSDLIKIKDEEGNEQLYSKGGLILIKIEPNDLNKNEDLKFSFNLEYITYDGNKCSQNYSYVIENKKEKEEVNNYFKDNNIKKGISIYYFCSILNYIVEIENKRNYEKINNKKEESKKQKEIKVLETRQAVSDYLNTNFVLEPNIPETKKILDNYMKIIDDRYTGFKEAVYNL